MRISLADTPGALAVGAAVPTTAGAPSAGTHLVEGGRGAAVWAAAAAARPSAPDSRAVEGAGRLAVGGRLNLVERGEAEHTLDEHGRAVGAVGEHHGPRATDGGPHRQAQQRARLHDRQHAAAKVHDADQRGRRAGHRRDDVEHDHLAGVGDVDGNRTAAQHDDAGAARGRPRLDGDFGGAGADGFLSGQSGPPS